MMSSRLSRLSMILLAMLAGGAVLALGEQSSACLAAQVDVPAPVPNQLGFVNRPPYQGDCKKRPTGTVCARYGDGYIWLIDERVTGWQKMHTGHGEMVQTAVGTEHLFMHILHTYLTKVGTKPKP